MRGEQILYGRKIHNIRGSPPLARGTASEAKKEWKRIGITPACAGNSKSFNSKTVKQRDHPRLRGEQIPYICAASSISDHPRLRGEQDGYTQQLRLSRGSPPLARGTADIRHRFILLSRITPACAGNSSFGFQFDRRRQDHPRLRGEQNYGRSNFRGSRGSPPLARGTACQLLHTGRRKGITPACAGNRVYPANMQSNGKDHPRLRGEQRKMKRAIAMAMGSPPLARGTVD